MGRRQRRYSRDGLTLQWRDGVPVAAWRSEETGKLTRVRLATAPTGFAQGQRLLEAFAESRRAVQVSRRSYTIGDLWVMWMRDRASDGLRCDIHGANWTSLAPHFASRTPEHLTADDCREYARDRFRAGRAPSTVHTELTRLRSCLRWAHSNRKIDVLPRVWVPAPSPARSRVLTVDELRRLLEGAAMGDAHVYTFVVLAITTGARHRAILDLTWDRVDWMARTISYDETIADDPMSKGWRKGRATVPMPRLALDALQIAHRGRQSAFVVEHGGRRLKSVRAGFAAACARAGLEGVTPHTIRHTVATLLRASGVANDRVALVLGHDDPRTTDMIYTHPSVEMIRDTADVIDEWRLDQIDGSADNWPIYPVGKNAP